MEPLNQPFLTAFSGLPGQRDIGFPCRFLTLCCRIPVSIFIIEIIIVV